MSHGLDGNASLLCGERRVNLLLNLPSSSPALPAPAVLLSAMFLGDKPSLPVALTLVPIIGGVVLASTSELSFTWKGFLSGEATEGR